jgi:predicted nucleotidyltransferase
MAQYGWSDCPEAIRVQVEGFVRAVREILAQNLVGIYLHGSLAMGCFNPERSDLDLLVLTREGMTVEVKRRVAELLLQHSGAPRPIEISFLRQADLDPWEDPTPFDFHYSEDWRHQTREQLESDAWQTWNDRRQRDPDLAAHVTITRERGICLAGPPIERVFPPVPRAHYVASIVGDVLDATNEGRDGIAGAPVYYVLNLCRVCAYLREGRICSKEEGGTWGARVLPDELRAVVRQALAAYRGTASDGSFDASLLEAFAGYLVQEIRTCRGTDSTGGELPSGPAGAAG